MTEGFNESETPNEIHFRELGQQWLDERKKFKGWLDEGGFDAQKIEESLYEWETSNPGPLVPIKLVIDVFDQRVNNARAINPAYNDRWDRLRFESYIEDVQNAAKSEILYVHAFHLTNITNS